MRTGTKCKHDAKLWVFVRDAPCSLDPHGEHRCAHLSRAQAREILLPDVLYHLQLTFPFGSLAESDFSPLAHRPPSSRAWRGKAPASLISWVCPRVPWRASLVSWASATCTRRLPHPGSWPASPRASSRSTTGERPVPRVGNPLPLTRVLLCVCRARRWQAPRRPRGEDAESHRFPARFLNSKHMCHACRNRGEFPVRAGQGTGRMATALFLLCKGCVGEGWVQRRLSSQNLCIDLIGEENLVLARHLAQTNQAWLRRCERRQADPRQEGPEEVPGRGLGAGRGAREDSKARNAELMMRVLCIRNPLLPTKCPIFNPCWKRVAVEAGRMKVVVLSHARPVVAALPRWVHVENRGSFPCLYLLLWNFEVI